MTLSAATVDHVVQHVEKRRTDIVDLVVDLVRIPSETHPPGGDEGPVQRRVEAIFRDLDLDVDVFEPWSVEGVTDHAGWWPGLTYDDRPNVVGTWRGAGGGRSLILNGHCDVVPAGPRDLWDRDPYGGEVADGKIHGRGSADQKAGIAAMTMAVACLRDLGLQPSGDVILESVVNEELGGYNGTLACCVKGYRADGAIITEPTELNVGPAAKGGQTYKATVPGRNAHHAFWWEGASALDGVLVLKQALVAWEKLREAELGDVPLFSDRTRYPRPVLADTIWYVRAGDPEIMATPSSAEVGFWVDVLPGDDREEVLARFEEHVRTATSLDPFLRDRPVHLERALMRPFTGVSVPVDHPVVASLERAHAAATRRRAGLIGMSGATDAMIFNLYSPTPAVVYGPGDLRVAHSPDEFVPVDEVVDATKSLALTILEFCGH